MRKDFFRVIDPEAFRDLLRDFAPLEVETLDIVAARGRYTALDVASPEDLPAADRASMDGFAVRAADTFGASGGSPAFLDVVDDVAIGVVPVRPIGSGECARIVTGAYLPPGADAVVMVEYAEELGQGAIEVQRPVAPGENVMLRAEDAALGEVALPAGTYLGPPQVGILAALGIAAVAVRARPRVAVISTGDELFPHDAPLAPGGIRDVNTPALCCMIADLGGLPAPFCIVRDDPEALFAALSGAVAENDMVLLSGGSSVGARDFTLEAVSRLPGARVLAHGVAISPGKPTLLAEVSGKAVFGLPGQVTSAQVVMRAFVLPLARHLMGDARAFDPPSRPIRAELSRNVASKPGREDHIRVRLTDRPGELPLATPILGKSGLLRTLLSADGITRIPANAEGLLGGSVVEVEPL